MSGIYGIFHLDGAPVGQEILPAMRDAMAYYGPDGGGQWNEGQIGLGHLLLCTTPEDSYEVQPVKRGDVILVTFARLDNRDELLRIFEYSSADYSTTPDSDLVLDAYLRWGTDCPDHINGDWQFAAWDVRRQTLYIARDHHGNTGLYYYRNSRFIAFASSQKALLAIPGVPCKPDMIKLAQILTAWPGEGWRSSHEEIHQLPPAHTMFINKKNVILKRYWYPENLPLIQRANDQEYIEEFISIYRQAVSTRLRSIRPIGVTLSAGLDSGSVTALAAPIMRDLNKPLIAFTSVPLYEPSGAGTTRTGNEWHLAAATARMAGDNIEHIALKSEGSSVLQGIKRQLFLHDGPGHAAGNQYWITDLMNEARKRNIGTLLSGQCGNASVSFAGNGQSLYFLLNGDIKSAINTFLYADSNPLLTIKRQILKPLLMPILRRYRSQILSSKSPCHAYSAINPGFAKRIGLHARMLEMGHDPTFSYSPIQRYQLKLMQLGSNSLGAIWHEYGAGYGMEVRDPTIDRRIIEFCLQIPDIQFKRNNQYRRLIKNAMNGILPQEVLDETKKGLQAADIVERVFSEKDDFTVLISKLEQSPLVRDCIDLARMRQIFSSYLTSNDSSLAKESITILLRGLGVGMFLMKKG
jgi:asparagine synthase (glutamine-hydrolysing)